MIPYGRQDITQADLDAVLEVLNSDFLTQGPKVPAFEKAVADKVGANHAVAANSATSALHIACRAVGLGPGDHLWTSPNTFVASANCALYCGAHVDFVDTRPDTFNMCPQKLAEKLTEAEANGNLPKVVVPVDLCGQPAELEPIRALADQYGFKIIEDASHAIGARYKGDYVGNGAFADITVFSFHPVKIITTAEGGMAVTNDAALAQRMALFRSHGITRDSDLMTHSPDGPWYYQQIELGFNYRLTDIQAALGLRQMERLDQYVERRNWLADRYEAALEGLPLSRQLRHPDSVSSWHLYVVQVQDPATHRPVFEALRDLGIGVNLHYIPVHTQPYYRQLGFKNGDFPLAEDYYRRSISIPLFATMTTEQQDTVVEALKQALKAGQS